MCLTKSTVYPKNKYVQTTKTYKFIGKVLPDGHLSIPEELAKDTAKEFEVVMTPIDSIKKTISLYLKGLIDKKGTLKDISLDSEKIEEAAIKAFGTTNIDVIIEAIRR